MHLQKTGSRVIPRDRQCCQTKADGHPCGAYTVKGRDRCHMHGFYSDLDNGRSSIEVPLLEDKNSILLVISQVARALGQGMMPASNANGIIRCCRVAQQLLEKEKAEGRSQESEAEEADESVAQGEPDQTDATVPCDCEVGAAPGIPAADPDGALRDAAPAVSEDAGSMQAGPEADPDADAEAGGNPDSPCDADEPQPWTVEPGRTFVPPPQFADAPDKFQRALDRASGLQLEALNRRNREIWRRGGSVLGG